MANNIRFEFDTDKMASALDTYNGAAKATLRASAQAGAQVLYDEMRTRAPVGTKEGNSKKPGTLRNSIYQVFSVRNSNDTRATFHIAPNKRKAPHWSLIENGHWSRSSAGSAPKWVVARPYIRPTWDGRGRDAVAAMRIRMSKLMQERGKAP